MSATGKINREDRQRQSIALSTRLRDELKNYMRPLIRSLYLQMDRCLVSTFVSLVEAIIRHRHNAHGLLLTEFGGEILSEDQAPAGTKRIGKLLKSNSWDACLFGANLVFVIRWKQGVKLSAGQGVEQKAGR